MHTGREGNGRQGRVRQTTVRRPTRKQLIGVGEVEQSKDWTEEGAEGMYAALGAHGMTQFTAQMKWGKDMNVHKCRAFPAQ
eukprot:1160443-Pelagomonas_calceolata.AAC.16